MARAHFPVVVVANEAMEADFCNFPHIFGHPALGACTHSYNVPRPYHHTLSLVVPPASLAQLSATGPRVVRDHRGALEPLPVPHRGVARRTPWQWRAAPTRYHDVP